MIALFIIASCVRRRDVVLTKSSVITTPLYIDVPFTNNIFEVIPTGTYKPDAVSSNERELICCISVIHVPVDIVENKPCLAVSFCKDKFADSIFAVDIVLEITLSIYAVSTYIVLACIACVEI